jgi:hypothetical protein
METPFSAKIRLVLEKGYTVRLAPPMLANLLRANASHNRQLPAPANQNRGHNKCNELASPVMNAEY